MSIVYISLAGTQVFSVLNPLIALRERHGGDIDSVWFLATFKARERFIRAMNYMEADPEWRKIPVNSILVSPELTAVGGMLPAHEALAAVSGKLMQQGNKTLYFNLAGGMNFQIPLCARALLPFNPVCLYPEYSGIHAFGLEAGRTTKHGVISNPLPGDVLGIQGIDYTESQEKGGGQKFRKMVDRIITDRKIPMNGTLSINQDIIIGNVHFDLVINMGNSLKLLKFVKTSKEMRKLNTLASSREPFFELYHRNIVALSPDPFAAERADAESGGKVTVVRYSKKNRKAMESRLGDILFPETAESVDLEEPYHKEQSVSAGAAKNADTALVTVLGPDPLPTFIALWSHKPKKAYIFYTWRNQKVCAIKDTMIANAGCLPTENITFVPVSFFGNEILDFHVDEKEIWVNITPGTKAHTFFLTSWAGLNQAHVYSSNNNTDAVEPLSGTGRTFKLKGPPPLDLIRLKGIAVKDHGESKGGLMADKALFEALLIFLKKAARDAKLWKRFPQNAIGLKGMRYVPKGENAILSISGASHKFKRSGGVWLERLAGFMMAKCGADDVSVRFRSAWSAAAQKRIEKIHDDRESFMTDVDVIARFKSKYYAISCKTDLFLYKENRLVENGDEKNNLKHELAQEAKAFASLLGRFCIPMVCIFKMDGEPEKVDGVWFFGIHILIHKEKFYSLISGSYNSVQKTRSVRKVVFSRADMDTCLAAYILGVTNRDRLLYHSAGAKPEHIEDAGVICIEAGGSGRALLNNYDHHDKDRYLAPACRQALSQTANPDPGLARLVDYVCRVDDGPPVDPPIPFPSLSSLFSGMRMVENNEAARFWEGIGIITGFLEDKGDPFLPVEVRPMWREYLKAKVKNRDRLEADLKDAIFFTTEKGCKAGFLKSDAIGGTKYLYDEGCEIAILYSPAYGDGKVPKYTICSNEKDLSGLIDVFNKREPGWGGRKHIIGSPRNGSRIRSEEVMEVVKKWM